VSDITSPLIERKVKVLNTNKKKEFARSGQESFPIGIDRHKKVNSFSNTILSQNTLAMSNMAGENTDCTHNTLGHETTDKLSSLRNENTSSVLSFDGLGPNLNSKENKNNQKQVKVP